mmetsp:Transcript_71856/g.145792  ORF Transcript_71856/g.145792 Transcript_71856/m.145792 type:complete len:298 (-) Transcript_71856:321-1214(-)
MKFLSPASYIVLATTLAFACAEAASLRGRSLSLGDGLIQAPEQQPNAPSIGFRRRLEENVEAEEEQQGEEGEANEQDEEVQGENAGNDDQGQNNNAGGNDDDAAAAQNDDQNDGYTFYDDLALQNCGDEDEDCARAATYTAYDDNYLANCGNDDEYCNEAAAYVTAKELWDAQQTGTTKSPQNISDRYHSMSRPSKIWMIVLAVWFSALVVMSSYLCCCSRKSEPEPRTRRSYRRRSSKKSAMRQQLMGENRRRSSDEEQAAVEKGGGRSKFRMFGRKESKDGRRSRSRSRKGSRRS